MSQIVGQVVSKKFNVKQLLWGKLFKQLSRQEVVDCQSSLVYAEFSFTIQHLPLEPKSRVSTRLRSIAKAYM